MNLMVCFGRPPLMMDAILAAIFDLVVISGIVTSTPVSSCGWSSFFSSCHSRSGRCHGPRAPLHWLRDISQAHHVPFMFLLASPPTSLCAKSALVVNTAAWSSTSFFSRTASVYFSLRIANCFRNLSFGILKASDCSSYNFPRGWRESTRGFTLT